MEEAFGGWQGPAERGGCGAGERGEVGVSQVLGFALARRQSMCACPLTPTYRQFWLVSQDIPCLVLGCMGG